MAHQEGVGTTPKKKRPNKKKDGMLASVAHWATVVSAVVAIITLVLIVWQMQS